MKHCQRCYSLYVNEASQCAKCQETVHLGTRRPQKAPSTKTAPIKRRTRPLHPKAQTKGAVTSGMARWSMTIIGMMVLSFPLFQGDTDNLFGQFGLESVSAATPMTPINPAEQRLKIATEAAQALRQQLTGLEASYRPGEPGLSTSDWKAQLGHLQQDYQIRGDTDSKRPDPIVEGALHGALQQLHSIEFAMRDARTNNSWAQVNDIKLQFERNLRNIDS